jgi:uncharacterized protein
MNATSLLGRTALVTGASSGLGVDFARQLAARGCNLILVARREELLESVRAELASRHSVAVDILPMDLAVPDAPQELYDRVKADGKVVDILINNAGYGLYGPFTEIPWSRERNMLELDIITLTHLTKLFVKDMVARDFGYIMLIASIGAFQPSPLYASYSAAKSYVLNFGEALSYELRTTNVHCTVVSPGITATEFLKVSGQQASLYQRLTIMQSSNVARIGVDSMLRGKPGVVPGRLNALLVWGNRLLPRRWSAAIAERLMVVG